MVALGWPGRAQALAAFRRPAPARGLARALVNRPSVLLLDEPLGALDLKLREQMQVELKAIQRQVGITFIYVTHDQGEALSMSDRIAVFNKGRIEQIASPAEIYEHPASAFVAGFVGVSNILSGAAAAAIAGAPPAFSIRPEKIVIAPAGHRRAGKKLRGRRHHHQRPLSWRQHALPCGAAGRRRTDGDRAEPRGDGLQRARPPGPGRAADLAAEPYPGNAAVSLASGATLSRRARSTRLSTALYLRPRLALAAAVAAASALARHHLSGLAAGPAGAELLLGGRFLRPHRLSADAEDLCRAVHPGQHRHHPAHGRHGGRRHHRLRRHRLSARLFHGAVCRRSRQGDLLSRGDAAAVVELSGARL